MFRYIKQYAESIGGVSIYPVISLLIFFLFFMVLLHHVRNMDKNKIKEISELPLDTDDFPADTLPPNNLKKA